MSYYERHIAPPRVDKGALYAVVRIGPCGFCKREDVHAHKITDDPRRVIDRRASELEAIGAKR